MCYAFSVSGCIETFHGALSLGPTECLLNLASSVPGLSGLTPSYATEVRLLPDDLLRSAPIAASHNHTFDYCSASLLSFTVEAKIDCHSQRSRTFTARQLSGPDTPISDRRATYLGHHHRDELVVVDHSVTVLVGLADHLGDLVVRELLAEVGCDVSLTLPKFNSLMTCLSSAAEMWPSLFLSKTLKASRISSSESVSCIFLAMRVMNSAKSIELFPSASTCRGTSERRESARYGRQADQVTLT